MSATQPQLAKLAIVRDQRYGNDEAGRGRWFEFVDFAIGRRVTSNRELSKAEASLVLDMLADEAHAHG